MEEYGQALAIDLITVFSCVVLLLRYGDLKFAHPATPYIVFHLHTVTSRLLGLANGAETLFSSVRTWIEAVTPAEIVRASLYCDIAFCLVTVVWIVFKANPNAKLRTHALRLDPRILRPALTVTFLIGVAAVILAIQGFRSSDGPAVTGEISTSSYYLILPGWFGLAVLGWAYYRGFGRLSSTLFAIYLTLMSLQGSNRYRVILAILLAVNIWVERRGLRWPSRRLAVSLVVAGVLFFPMKQLANVIQAGEDLSMIFDTTTDSVSEVSKGSAPDQAFLDEMACGLSLMDMQGKLYFGALYLPLITLPIPRMIWPDKPILSSYIYDISTRERPMARSGMITTYLGEAYANFGVGGIFLIPPIVALLLALFYRVAHASPYDSVLRLSYTLLSVNLIQVYRDGLQSVIVFTFVNMMPLVIIVGAHLVVAVLRPAKASSPFSTEASGGAGTKPTAAGGLLRN